VNGLIPGNLGDRPSGHRGDRGGANQLKGGGSALAEKIQKKEEGKEEVSKKKHGCQNPKTRRI